MLRKQLAIGALASVSSVILNYQSCEAETVALAAPSCSAVFNGNVSPSGPDCSGDFSYHYVLTTRDPNYPPHDDVITTDESILFGSRGITSSTYVAVDGVESGNGILQALNRNSGTVAADMSYQFAVEPLSNGYTEENLPVFIGTYLLPSYFPADINTTVSVQTGGSSTVLFSSNGRNGVSESVFSVVPNHYCYGRPQERSLWTSNYVGFSAPRSNPRFRRCRSLPYRRLVLGPRADQLGDDGDWNVCRRRRDTSSPRPNAALNAVEALSRLAVDGPSTF